MQSDRGSILGRDTQMPQQYKHVMHESFIRPPSFPFLNSSNVLHTVFIELMHKHLHTLELELVKFFVWKVYNFRLNNIQ